MMEDKTGRIIREVSSFFALFALVAFAVSCCMMLFLNTMASSMGLVYTSEDISDASKITMLNAILITVIFYVIDRVRRYFTIEKPARRIIEAADRIMKGDFSYRIAITRPYELWDELDMIADRINRMAQALSTTESLHSDFISNVSHEIKTPLAVMKNYATLLRVGGVSDVERQEYARAIEDAAGRLSTLVANILRLNKLENQQISPRFEKYDLSEQVCRCLIGLEDVWEKKGIEIETDIEDGICVLGDEDMMELVWSNLISNALKFTESGGTVAVSVHADGEYALVSVRDTGCGMSGSTGNRIFEKFYQGDTSHSQAGNGLGLALVKRVIDITGSSISVESELGVGSTFTVRIRRRS